ncbi:hypothetical protein Skr01_21530 [Sphaerisporangium krabiense]|nr:hypothetical protein Skr01_21530 [Sphaerisporangium krabiense]
MTDVGADVARRAARDLVPDQGGELFLRDFLPDVQREGCQYAAGSMFQGLGSLFFAMNDDGA